MSAADFFFISAGLGIWIIALSWLLIFYKVTHFVAKIEREAKSAKNNLKLSGLTLASKILALTKGGEIHDSKR